MLAYSGFYPKMSSSLHQKLKINTKTMDQPTMQFNIEVPTHILRQVANPGQNRNCYDSKVIEHFDVDDFKEYVEDNLNADNQLVEGDKYGLTDHIFPVGFNPIEDLAEGSDCNDNEHFNKYGTWRAALYDIWEDVKAYSGAEA